MKIVPVAHTRQLLVRFHAGDVLPDALLGELRKHQVTAGSVQLSGVVKDVELAAYSAELEGLGGTKHIAGPLQAIVLEGNLGVADGDACVDLRVVLARETDRGLETIGGQLSRARVVGLEGVITAFEGMVVPRARDKSSGLRLLVDTAIAIAAPAAHDEPAPAHSPPPPRVSAPAPAPSSPSVPPAAGSWSDAVAASASAHPARPPATLSRPPRRIEESEDGPYPSAGDTAEHFAFGSCEVLKSDGDRLHLRMKDGRIREIALEMLKVTLLGQDPSGGDKRRFRLDRKL